MIYTCLFLLSLFSSITAMEIAQPAPSKNWISLKVLVRLEGYRAAKARGDMVSIHQSAANLIEAWQKKEEAGIFIGNPGNDILDDVKQDIYATKQLYTVHQPYFDVIDNWVIDALYINEKHNRLFIATAFNYIAGIDITTKKCFSHIRPDFRTRCMNVNNEGLLVITGQNDSGKGDAIACDSFSGNPIYLNANGNEVDTACRWQLQCPQSKLTLDPFTHEGIIAIKDEKNNNLTPITLPRLKNKARTIAVDSRNDTIYVGTLNSCLSSSSLIVLSPSFNYKQAMEESDLLALAVVAHGISVDSQEVMKRSGDGCTIL